MNRRSRRPQFGLRTLFAATFAVALVTAWYANRHRQMRHAAYVLEKNGVVFSQGETAPLWYDRLPFLRPPPRIVELTIGRGTDMTCVVPELQSLGTVRRVNIYELSPRNLELLSQIDSIRVVEASWGLTTEQLGPLLSLPLEEYSVTGADVNIPRSQVEMLLDIPTMKRIGMASGESGVPLALRQLHPNVSYFRTDFPP
jgi:hypothetical protein